MEWNDWRGQQQREGMVGFILGLGAIGQVQSPIIYCVPCQGKDGGDSMEMIGLDSFWALCELICSDTLTVTTFPV